MHYIFRLTWDIYFCIIFFSHSKEKANPICLRWYVGDDAGEKDDDAVFSLCFLLRSSATIFKIYGIWYPTSLYFLVSCLAHILSLLTQSIFHSWPFTFIFVKDKPSESNSSSNNRLSYAQSNAYFFELIINQLYFLVVLDMYHFVFLFFVSIQKCLQKCTQADIPLARSVFWLMVMIKMHKVKKADMNMNEEVILFIFIFFSSFQESWWRVKKNCYLLIDKTLSSKVINPVSNASKNYISKSLSFSLVCPSFFSPCMFFFSSEKLLWLVSVYHTYTNIMQIMVKSVCSILNGKTGYIKIMKPTKNIYWNICLTLVISTHLHIFSFGVIA